MHIPGAQRSRVPQPSKIIGALTPTWIRDAFDAEARRLGVTRSFLMRKAMVAYVMQRAMRRNDQRQVARARRERKRATG